MRGSYDDRMASRRLRSGFPSGQSHLAAGVPARVIKSADEYLEKLKSDSLHLGRLVGEEKAKELRKHFGITWS